MVNRSMILQTISRSIGLPTQFAGILYIAIHMPVFNVIFHATASLDLFAADDTTPGVATKTLHQFRNI